MDIGGLNRERRSLAAQGRRPGRSSVPQVYILHPNTTERPDVTGPVPPSGFPVQPLLLTYKDRRIARDDPAVRPEVAAAIALCEAHARRLKEALERRDDLVDAKARRATLAAA